MEATVSTPSPAMIETGCPLCGSREWCVYTWAPSHYGPETHRVTRCRDCAMIFTNPQPTTYLQQVKSRGALARHFDRDAIEGARRVARLQLRTLARLSSGRRILDFGCGNGAFVREALTQGWLARGADLNAGLVAEANRFWGFDALRSESLDALIERWEGYFDAVMTNQVLEHIQEPRIVGESLLRLLKPGGLLYIDVPNARQLAEWLHRGKTLDPTSHWNHFTLSTLKRFVQRLGCTVAYASAAPSLIGLYGKFVPDRVAIALGRLSRRVLPPWGSGVCVIARKPERAES